MSQLISVQQLVSCASTDTLEHARHLMNMHHIRHLPVIDNYSLIGVVSIRDISTAFDEEASAAALRLQRKPSASPDLRDLNSRNRTLSGNAPAAIRAWHPA